MDCNAADFTVSRGSISLRCLLGATDFCVSRNVCSALKTSVDSDAGADALGTVVVAGAVDVVVVAAGAAATAAVAGTGAGAATGAAGAGATGTGVAGSVVEAVAGAIAGGVAGVVVDAVVALLSSAAFFAAALAKASSYFLVASIIFSGATLFGSSGTTVPLTDTVAGFKGAKSPFAAFSAASID